MGKLQPLWVLASASIKLGEAIHVLFMLHGCRIKWDQLKPPIWRTMLATKPIQMKDGIINKCISLFSVKTETKLLQQPDNETMGRTMQIKHNWIRSLRSWLLVKVLFQFWETIFFSNLLFYYSNCFKENTSVPFIPFKTSTNWVQSIKNILIRKTKK